MKTGISKKLFLISLFLLFVYSLNGQNNLVYTQYQFNGLIINPAYTGTHDALALNTVIRKQWINTPESPYATSLSAHSPVLKKKISVGGLIYHSKVSIINDINVQGTISYRINFSNQRSLSMGMATGYSNVVVRYNELTTDLPDPSIPQNRESYFSPEISSGFFYKGKNSKFGISAIDLLPLKKTVFISENYTHYFLYVAKNYSLTSNSKIIPSLLIHRYTSAVMLFDVNLALEIYNALWIGASYRHLVSTNYIIRLRISPQLTFSYSYDLPWGKNSVTRTGAHEIGVSYVFSYYKNAIRPSLF